MDKKQQEINGNVKQSLEEITAILKSLVDSKQEHEIHIVRLHKEKKNKPFLKLRKWLRRKN